MPLTRPLYRQEDLNPADITTEISDAIAAYDSPANGTYGRKDGAWVGVALAIETRSANFTAVVGGRYQTTAALTITDPATRIDGSALQDGDSYEVWIGGGNATIGGSAFAPSRHSIRRARLSGAWTTPTPTISGTLTVGSGTWSGSVVTGDQSFSGQVQLTGQSATNANSAMTRGLADTRYGRQIICRLTSDVSSNSLSYVDGPSFSVPAGTYRIEGEYIVIGTSATAGCVSRVLPSVAETLLAARLTTTSTTALGTATTNANHTPRLGASLLNFFSALYDGGGSARVGFGGISGIITFASSTTLTFQIAQRTAADAAAPALFKAGSHLILTEIL